MSFIRYFVLALSLLGPGGALDAADGAPSPDASWINQFDRKGDLEENWRYEGTRFMVPRTKFYLEKEKSASDGNILVVDAKKSTGILMAAPSPVDLKKTPIMRWRWRLVRPIALEPGEKEPDDQAVVVYFGDGTLLKQRCVAYRWERDSKLGYTALRKYAAGMMTVFHKCVANKSTPLGEWQIEEHDVVADYTAAFGAPPKEYFVISVGANSQYSESHTRAEIDFIEFVPRQGTVLNPDPTVERPEGKRK